MGSGLGRLSVRPMHIPFARPIITPNYEISGIYSILLRVEDTDGGVGWSYLWCVSESQIRPLIAMAEGLAPTVAALDPTDPQAVYDALENEINFLGFKGVSVFALSAFDMALWDLRLNALGRSLSEHWGQRRARVHAYWSGLMLSETDDQLRAEAIAAAEQGFDAFKIRIGRNSIADDVARVGLVRDVVGDDATLMVDAVQFYAPDTAVEMAAALADLEVRWFEEPVRHDRYDDLASIVSRTRVPIASGENEYLPGGFDHLIATDLSYLVVDLERVGGITGWAQVVGRCERGPVVTPHVYPHIGTHLGAAMDGEEVWVEYMDWWDPLMAYELRLEDGHMLVPDVPGTGVVPDVEAVDRYAMAPWRDLGEGNR